MAPGKRTKDIVALVLPGAAEKAVAAPKKPFKSPKGRIELATPEKDKIVQVINMYRSPRTKRIRPGSWNNIVKALEVYGEDRRKGWGLRKNPR